jgi:hypothetical protein
MRLSIKPDAILEPKSGRFFKNARLEQSGEPRMGDTCPCQTEPSNEMTAHRARQPTRTATDGRHQMETIMSKFILSTLAALVILSGVSSSSIAAPRDADGSFPAKFWEELHEKAAG